MRTTIHTPAGRIVIQPSATGASVQITFFPADRTAAPCGFLIPNASAGVAAQALEAVATINEESTPPELAALPAIPENRKCSVCANVLHCMTPAADCAPLAAARAFADGLPELAP